MKTAREHYDTHLAAIYDWMAGGFENAVVRNSDFFDRLKLDDVPRGLAIDLGAGSGFQSIPLAELGFPVLAIDFSADLLGQLQKRAKHLPVRIVQDDILNFPRHFDGTAQIIVCMGDTLTHLKSFEEVRKLILEASNLLADDAILILTFRDYFSAELKGNQRFIPVRSDEMQILTCFLEYFEKHIEVHDLLYTKKDSGWNFSVSSYPKLRLNPQSIVDELGKSGFSSVSKEYENGMVKIIAKR